MAASLLLHVTFLVVGTTVLAGVRWPNLPLHTLVESMGAYIALTLAPMLLLQDKRGQGTSFNGRIAAAILAMGLLDGLHGLLPAGNAFVWLHSIATLAGGVLFATIWIPTDKPVSRGGIWFTVVLSVLLGGGSMLDSAPLPAMVDQGSFTATAKLINIAGGVLLCLAAVRLVLSYRATRNRDDLLFVIHCILFGGAAIMFESSRLWDTAWWGWHILRLLAYAVALVFVVQSVRDEQRQMQQLNVSLKEEIEARRKAQRETEQAMREASAANAAKGDFLANMSHEIRTPMNTIVGVNDLLRHTKLDADQERWLEVSHRSSQALLAIVQDILDFSKIEAGSLELETTDFQLHDCVWQVVEGQRVLAEKNAVSIDVTIAPDVPNDVLGDPIRLAQVLRNLINNAIKFSPKDGLVAVRVSRSEPSAAEPLEPLEEASLHFEVEDHGIGIANETLGHLFDAFAQADTTTTRKFGGTGLGLSICRRLVDAMGGHIDVQSELDRGSRFFFTIALGISTKATENARAPASAPAPAKPAKQRSHVAPLALPPGVPSRLLIVEDNPVNQKVLTAIVKLLGFEADIAADGQSAIDTLDERSDGHYAAVLMDCQMPVMDGYTAASAIRASEASQGRGRAIMIAVTGQALSGDRERVIDAGMDDYVSKPVKIEVLRATLERWISES